MKFYPERKFIFEIMCSIVEWVLDVVDYHTCVNTGRTFSAIVTECVKQVALAISISPSSSDKTLSDARSLESVAIAKDAEALAFTPQPLAFALTCGY